MALASRRIKQYELDPAELERVAREGEHLDARLVAVERIFSQGVLADLLRSPENLELIGMCFSRITDRRIIESIAEDPAYSPAVRRMAVEYYADESYLEDASKQAEAEPERKSEEAVEAFHAKRPPEFSLKPGNDMPDFYPWWPEKQFS